MIKAIKSGMTSYLPIILFVTSSLVVLSLFRLGYLFLFHDRVLHATTLTTYFLLGLRADIIQVGYFTLIPLLLFPFFNNSRLHRRWFQLSLIWLAFCFIVIVFLEVATPAFLMQYDTRPNRLFFEYLLYPKEVLSTLWEGFRGWLIFGVISVGLTLYGLTKAINKVYHQCKQRKPHHVSAWILWPFIVIVTVLGIRSTLAHRPANPAFFAVTSDAMVNSLLINSSYSVAYAAYNLKHEAKANSVYGDLSDSEVIQIVTAEPHLSDATFPSKQYPTVHYQQASVTRDKPLNIVIILEESLGATFVESLGGIAATPNLEKLKNNGWWFEQLYATGIRSVRGIEAVVAGFPPSRARSTVKLSNSQRYFFTIADALKRQGYHTEFIYGGESHFDNMAAFFSGNGFEQIIDQDDFENPLFVGSWGVSDQDLFQKLHNRLVANKDSQQPTFTLAFSSSNHEPFEFPVGDVTLLEQPQNTVNNAVKYADHALGEFFNQAMASEYWQNTLFLVVADHDTRVYGDELIPLSKFHIPGLILGADISPRKVTSIASQIDLAPTLLSIAGVSTFVPTLGQDLSRTDIAPANRAFMQFGDNFGWFEDDHLTVLTLDKGHQEFSYDATSKTLTPSMNRLNEKALQRIRAHAMLPSVLYENRMYYVPPELH
ncbi:LTA synthase family protein [Pseudidiomarina tainanensis]|jgi:phosphoglycerol transferase MdoB-like AlkP superfamily enzyme|uniref:Phosphoglycerol transferase MdoB n=2 Tax=Pseudidiomarina TaxID=2800384 RepID=A0A1I6G5N1_9GAMM|nr:MULTISPECIES: LTA synthase family protein [Pseudidiomarina]RZQ57121.1 LTA synthase family protein [Pseudidiomarina tainanensis]SFR37482.1 Phosphoglycerol transferase MdoB [Pseudidiomarina maritima]